MLCAAGGSGAFDELHALGIIDRATGALGRDAGDVGRPGGDAHADGCGSVDVGHASGVVLVITENFQAGNEGCRRERGAVVGAYGEAVGADFDMAHIVVQVLHGVVGP